MGSETVALILPCVVQTQIKRAAAVCPIYLPRLMATDSILKQVCCCVLPGKNHSTCMEDALPPFLAT